MKRFMSMCAAALATGALVLTGAPSAGAQSIDCSTHVYNDTTMRGKYDVGINQIEGSIANFNKVAPTAEVYVHAYEHIPGGSLTAFIDTARQQCGWGDNSVVIVYGHDIDDIGLFEGNDFVVLEQYQNEIMNGVKAGLGPTMTQTSSDGVTSVLVDTLSAARFYLRMSVFYDKKTETYVPRSYEGEQPIHHWDLDWSLTKMIVVVIAGFVALGLIVQLLINWIKKHVVF